MDVRGKALLGLAHTQLALFLMLFVPAWSLTYWEAWVYWLLGAASGLFITQYFLRYDPALMERRVEVGPAFEPERSQRIIQSITATLSCSMFIVAGFEHRFHGSKVPLPMIAAALVVLLLATLLIFRVFRENSYTSATVRVESGQRVISTGPYAWIRHPMYTASIAIYLVTPLALGSLWGIIPGVLVATMIVVRLLAEEHYLAQNLPGYEDYRRQVPFRLIPFVW